MAFFRSKAYDLKNNKQPYGVPGTPCVGFELKQTAKRMSRLPKKERPMIQEAAATYSSGETPPEPARPRAMPRIGEDPMSPLLGERTPTSAFGIV